MGMVLDGEMEPETMGMGSLGVGEGVGIGMMVASELDDSVVAEDIGTGSDEDTTEEIATSELDVLWKVGMSSNALDVIDEEIATEDEIGASDTQILT